MPEQDYKRCGRCGEEKPLENFHRDSHARDGRQGTCKDCRREHDRRRYIENGAAMRQTAQEWREKNREHERSRKRAYRRKDPQRTAEAKRLRYQREPEKDRARVAVYEATQRGTLERPSQCQRCAITAEVQAHHHDYSKPLDVEWLCRSCHADVHRR